MTATFDPFTTSLPVSQWPTAPVEVDRVAELLRQVRQLDRALIERMVNELSTELQDSDPKFLEWMDSMEPSDCPF